MIKKAEKPSFVVIKFPNLLLVIQTHEIPKIKTTIILVIPKNGFANKVKSEKKMITFTKT